MSKKFYLITVASTLSLSILIILSFVYFESKRHPENYDQVTLPKEEDNNEKNYANLPIEEISQKPKLEIQTKEGSVEINNVYKKIVEKLSQNGVSFADNDDYYIAFYPKDNGFLITINNPDVVSAAKKAEAGFLNDLGISKDDACKLKVSITVPAGVNEKYSGKIYGFSFCSGVEVIK